MMLTQDSINKFYYDRSGNEVMILSQENPCCRIVHYKGNILGTNNIYCYDPMGRRIDFTWNASDNSLLNLVE